MKYTLSGSSARVDGLSKRELTASEMLEHFEQREDHLYQRLTTYTKPVGRKEPSTGQHRREIQVRSPLPHHCLLCGETGSIET